MDLDLDLLQHHGYSPPQDNLLDCVDQYYASELCDETASLEVQHFLHPRDDAWSYQYAHIPFTRCISALTAREFNGNGPWGHQALVGAGTMTCLCEDRGLGSRTVRAYERTSVPAHWH
ncbi:hypothetical protein KVR01_004700 [Diaporthe batatas]|uniref:uncharacterized protein n=1 Tax=Diaporthe batatas TaxID=748121 RepID=UPI001D04B274|nr:uncharacterized protein KVR01_004700 [Diaporthe batatas]KAG8166148.1 hypothetical protein KVR01_004700 [Diaporthe batatas]